MGSGSGVETNAEKVEESYLGSRKKMTWHLGILHYIIGTRVFDIRGFEVQSTYVLNLSKKDK